jgi:NADH dehydrogenase
VQKEKIATIFGGTGFVGRYVVRNLARAGYRVKIVTRVPERAYFLRPLGQVGQIVAVACNDRDPVSIASVIRGSDVVVNCIGILYEKKRGDFQRVHTNLPGLIAQACAASGVSHLVHISALGVVEGTSRYAKSKLQGELALQQGFPAATILRPSVVFGPEDNFFNLFASMAQFLPVLPLIGGGQTQLQPVYVEDVADAVLAVVDGGVGPHSPQGKIYELGGPEILTLEQIYKIIFAQTGRRRLLMPLSFCLSKIIATVLQVVPPKPLLTPDQVESLKTDNVVSANALGLDDLGIRPGAVNLIVSAYLERFRSGGRFPRIKSA